MSSFFDVLTELDAAKLTAFRVEGVKGSGEKLAFPPGWQTFEGFDIFGLSLEMQNPKSILAVRCGEIVCVDVDSAKAADTQAFNARFVEFMSENFADFFGQCYFESTPSGGLHLIFRVNFEVRNKKLVLPTIEIRGSGGCVFVAPSQGYCKLHGGFIDLPELSPDDFGILISALKSEFSEAVPKVENTRAASTEFTERPGDLFNRLGYPKAVEILENHGFSRVKEDGKTVWMKRPGDSSQFFSLKVFKDSGVTFCFSTSTALPPETGLMPFQIYTLLNHNGDHSEAAKAIRSELGVSTSTNPIKPSDNAPNLSENAPEVKEIDPNNYIITNWDNIHPPEFLAEISGESETVRTFSRKSFTLIGAANKAGKSSFFALLIVAATAGKKFLSVAFPKPLRVLLGDTEQPAHRLLTLRKLMSGFGAKLDLLTVLHLRSIGAKDRRKVLSSYLDAHGHTFDVVILDGVQDFFPDFNNEAEAGVAGDFFLELLDRFNFHIFISLHLNKGNAEFAEVKGHLGNSLMQKCETYIKLIKKKDPMRVLASCILAREDAFEDFEYFLGKEGAHLVDGSIPGEGFNELFKQTASPATFPESVHTDYVNSIFGEGKQLSRSELDSSIELHFSKLGAKMSERQINSWRVYWESKGLIRKVGKTRDGRPYPPFAKV